MLAFYIEAVKHHFILLCYLSISTTKTSITIYHSDNHLPQHDKNCHIGKVIISTMFFLRQDFTLKKFLAFHFFFFSFLFAVFLCHLMNPLLPNFMVCIQWVVWGGW